MNSKFPVGAKVRINNGLAADGETGVVHWVSVKTHMAFDANTTPYHAKWFTVDVKMDHNGRIIEGLRESEIAPV
jgi:hypothetical protein